MQAAVIISTYNSPQLLEKVLWGYAGQTCRDFELIVADDGSTANTRQLIEDFAATEIPVKHVWHADRGFRKCTILNRAIASTEAEYIILTDGDCIPRHDFVATHLALREAGRFLSGGTVWLPKHVSEQLQIRDVIAGRATDYAWLRANGLGGGMKRTLRLATRPGLQRLCDAATITKPTLNGHNASAWRRDLLAANGFDERLVYGGLDRELGERLENAGVRGKQIRHRAVCVHLYHERSYESARGWRNNDAIRHDTRTLGLTVTAYGIAQLPAVLPFPSLPIGTQLGDPLREARKAA